MTRDEKKALREDMAATIKARCPDPAGWLIAIRQVVEAVDVDPARAIPLGGVTLDMICYEVLSMADKMDVSSERIQNAIKALGT